MTIEIKTSAVQPIRNTFANLTRRFGDKPATRYQEATYDIQPEGNEHYRPTWDADHELVDARRTAIVMQDWYEFKDPRQFYYGSYVAQRAKMQETAENNYSFFEKRDLINHLDDEITEQLVQWFVPVRHIEQAANLNNMYCCAYGFGTAITQAFLYNGMDRLGMAQYLSRIGLILDGNTGDSLTVAKEAWMNAERWQPMRELCENLLLIKDWYELFIAQNVVLDTYLVEVFYNQYDQLLSDKGAQDVGMLTEFMRDWAKDASRWSDATLKTAATESSANKDLIQAWITKWRARVSEALSPVAEALVGADAIANASAVLDKRIAKAGV